MGLGVVLMLEFERRASTREIISAHCTKLLKNHKEGKGRESTVDRKNFG